MDSLGFSIFKIMSSIKGDGFTSFFLIWLPFISLSCLIALVRISSAMLSRSGERRYPCCVPHLRNYSVFYHGFFVDALYQVEEIPFNSLVVECFPHKQVLHFVTFFFCIYWDDNSVLHYLISGIKPTMHSWDKSHLAKVSFVVCCCIGIASILLSEDFCLCVH